MYAHTLTHTCKYLHIHIQDHESLGIPQEELLVNMTSLLYYYDIIILNLYIYIYIYIICYDY